MGTLLRDYGIIHLYIEDLPQMGMATNRHPTLEGCTHLVNVRMVGMCSMNYSYKVLLIEDSRQTPGVVIGNLASPFFGTPMQNPLYYGTPE